jgi:hypothetical protein
MMKNTPRWTLTKSGILAIAVMAWSAALVRLFAPESIDYSYEISDHEDRLSELEAASFSPPPRPRIENFSQARIDLLEANVSQLESEMEVLRSTLDAFESKAFWDEQNRRR